MPCWKKKLKISEEEEQEAAKTGEKEQMMEETKEAPKEDIKSISQQCEVVVESGDLDGRAPLTAGTATFILLSFVYCKILVVLCIAYTIAEIRSDLIPLYYFEPYFTFLYGGSILFILYVFCYLLSGSNRAGCKKKEKTKTATPKSKGGMFSLKKGKGEAAGEEAGSPTQQKLTSSTPPPPAEKPAKKTKTTEDDRSHGTFFLRIGALLFGLGTMLYCGLEFGEFFDIPMDSPCHNILRGVNPCLQMVFTFMQMYFIFMNSRLNIHKWKCVARFGLMHVVGTNICIWVRVLVKEILTESNKFMDDNNTWSIDEMILGAKHNLTDTTPTDNLTCNRTSIMGTIVSDSVPYLFPLVVEYSLIGAGVLYVMWKHIGYAPRYLNEEEQEHLSQSSRRCYTKVDCVGASKGLFTGLLFFVVTAIAVLIFFILVKNEEFSPIAIYLADSSHALLLFLTLIAIFIGFCRVQTLKFHAEKEDELNDLLLRVSAFGLFLYAVFSAIAGFKMALTSEKHILLLSTSILNVLQVTVQLLFMGDVSRRSVYLPEHETRKPGRQIVTFLLISNLALWLMYTFELQKVEAHPIQLEFYGELPWRILVLITLPLAIFHRFLSAVVLADIWKNTYKAKSD